MEKIKSPPSRAAWIEIVLWRRRVEDAEVAAVTGGGD